MTSVVVPDSIDATGATDTTSALNDWIASFAPGTSASLAAGGKYRIDGTVEFSKQEGISFDGGGALLVAGTDGTETPDPRTRCHVRLDECADFAITNLTVKGANPNGGTDLEAYVAALEAQHGIWIAGGESITINANTISDVYGDFVYVAGSANEVSITNNVGCRNGRQGMSICDARNVTIAGNALDEIRRGVFDLEPATLAWIVDGLEIRNNLIGAHRENFIASRGEGPVDNVVIDGNLVHDDITIYVRPPDGVRRLNWTVTGNTGDHPYGTPSGCVMKFYAVDGLTVTGNTQLSEGTRLSAMVANFDCTGVVSDPNTITYPS